MTEKLSLSRWKAATGVLGLLLVAALVAVTVLALADDDPAPGGGTSGAPAAANAPAQVLLDAEKDADAAARVAAVALTTYDYKTFDHDLAWAKDGGTAKFQQQYAEVSARIRSGLVELQAHAEGSVIDSAAHATDADHVTVLLFIDQTLTDKRSTERKLDQPRMTMFMVRSGGRWLLDQVKINNLSAF